LVMHRVALYLFISAAILIQKYGSVSVAGEKHSEMSQSGTGDKSMEHIVQDVVLTCCHKFFSDKLQMHYTVTNHSSKDIYLVDVYPGDDPKSGKAAADYNAVYACLKNGNAVYLLRGIAPLPADRHVYVRIMPLGEKLAPGQSIERMFEVPLPLREQNRWYYAPLNPEGYDIVKVKTLILAVQFLRSTIEGFNAEPAPYGPDLYRVRGKDTVGQAETMTYKIAVQGLQMLKRKDFFSRIEGSISSMGEEGKQSIGSAKMEEDGTIVLELRAEGPKGLTGDALLRYPPGHPEYNNILHHLGGLKKGEVKQVPPWSNE
jgi:hypothetical protein